MLATLPASLPQPFTVVSLFSCPNAHRQVGSGSYYLWSAPGIGRADFLWDGNNLPIINGGVSVSAGIPAFSGRQRLIATRYNGASSFASVDGVDGPAVNAGTDSISQFRLFANAANVDEASAYWQGSWICSGALTPAEMAELTAYVDHHLRPTFTAGAFPTFGAADYDEWYADDFPTADGATIAVPWAGRHNGYELDPFGTPTMRTTGGPNGGAAVEFNGTDYFDCVELTWSQPGTFIVEARETEFDSYKFFTDGIGAGGRWAIYRDPAGGRPAIYAGANLYTSLDWQGLQSFGWRHYAGVFDGANSIVSIDGLDPQTGNPGAANLTGGLRVGIDSAVSVGSAMKISWIGAWNKALTIDQIRSVLRYRGMI